MATLNNFSVMVSSLKMSGKQSKVLHGLTWKHDRGLAPLLATARHFSEARPEVTIEWEARSLQEFGETLLQGLADRYELIVIDHPFMGRVAKEKCFLPLDQYFTPPQLRELEENSVGQSYQSYHFDGHQWALPIDAAAQVAGYRADLLEANGFKVPQSWEEVFELAAFQRGFVTPALSPLDSLICFFTLCANFGEPPFSRRDTVVSKEIGEQALERLRLMAEHAADGALSSNPIAIWERMSSSDEIAYCPLAFGYSNYARKRYRPKLISFSSMPSSGLGPVGATLGGAGLAISQNCKHLEAALEYALWLAGKECQSTVYVESGGQPGNKAAWVDAHANAITNGYFTATLPTLESAWLRPRFAGFEEFQVQALKVVAEFMEHAGSCLQTLTRLNELYMSVLVENKDIYIAESVASRDARLSLQIRVKK